MESESKLVCSTCKKTFSSVSTKNRHLKTVHNQKVEEKMSQYIKCPLCPEEKKQPFANHDSLLHHLTEVHSVIIKESKLNFRNLKEFEAWRAEENREVDYACSRKIKHPSGEDYLYYNCNRADSRGFKSTCTKRAMKAGGSIRISGICPSRISAKILINGMISVKFIETHVGHEDELRTKRLLKKEQAMIVEQLNAGVSNERILQDARIINSNKLERINLIRRADLRYLIRKFNIDKQRNEDDMIATALKVEEWNKEGKNQAFLFKKIGESHPYLREEDFAVGYMNNMMEKKLKDFKRIICVDGTHGTNRRNWELTTVLVKDDQNMGFPVAFLISNRLDQVIQNVFFSALKEKLGEDIDAEYIMSDDDPKYYNAWTEVMKTDKKPRRLLCTWHIIKNWNIQGRSKLKKQENRSEMKKEMKKILKETKTDNFIALKEKYLNHLKEEGEVDFVNYLEKYYFQNDDRIKMWAHCYRIGVGINTNMAIESLNKVLKHNTMNGNRNIRIEKLLDLLEELVKEKMWKRILNTERPDANNYQHKCTVKAHMKAEEIKDLVELVEFGKFKVKSSTGEKFYIISCNELCDEDCRAVYCNECKICIHRFTCDCPEYAVKTALCKHIHAVVLYERRRGKYVPGFSDMGEENSDENLFVQEPTTTRMRYEEELFLHLKETCENQKEDSKTISSERSTQVMREEVLNYTNTADRESLEKLTGMVRTLKKNVKQESVDKLCKKRKIEKQTYYPNKK